MDINQELHAPGLAEIHDAKGRCIASCCDVDPVPEEQRPVPDVEEGDQFAARLVACWNACRGISTEELERRGAVLR